MSAISEHHRYMYPSVSIRRVSNTYTIILVPVPAEPNNEKKKTVLAHSWCNWDQVMKLMVISIYLNLYLVLG